MEGDFTKLQLNPWDNFTGLLHQQGRGFLDEDFNASTQITGHLRQLLGQDTIGAHVAAVPAEERNSFKVTKAETVLADNKVKITLEPGRVWLDGLVLLVEERPKPLEVEYMIPPIKSKVLTKRDAVILEVWEDAFNAFQDPLYLIEPALGGVDTTERIKLFHRLRLLRLGPNDECGDLADRLEDNFKAKGKLTVTPADTLEVTGECPVEMGGGYTGFEHYLYRIEVATPTDDGKARFKWSRFNGGLVGRGTYDSNSAEITITANDQMINHCGLDSFFLEALQEGLDGGPWKATFTADAALLSDGKLSLTNIHGTWPGDNGDAFFRLWDGIKLISAYSPDAEKLENGILLTFDPPAVNNSNYTPGDYWTFPVRAQGLDAELPPWPSGDEPQGIHYHRAPLAILDWSTATATSITFDQGEISDCRRVFQPLTAQSTCCTFTVGDGVHSQGHFNSITEALRHLPEKGGKLCLLPGEHRTNAKIKQRQDIEITGCGFHTIVNPVIEHAEEPIFSIDTSERIQIENMTLVTSTGTAIQIKDEASLQEASQGISIVGNRIMAQTHAIEVAVNDKLAGNNDIRIFNNEIGIFDMAEGKAAIFCLADNVVIENNRIIVIPAPDADDTNDPRDPQGPGRDFFDICDRLKFYKEDFPKRESLRETMRYLESTTYFKQHAYLAQGGIQIGGGSERVRIIGNRIIGGNGNGITLGHVPLVDDNGSDSYSSNPSKLYDEPPPEKINQLKNDMIFALYEIVIEDNTIQNMGLSGIGLPAFFNLEKTGLIINIEDLTVYRNNITYCAHLLPTEIPEDMKEEVGFGGIVLGACENVIIQENRIENNGQSQIKPVCGILILYGEIIDISNNRIINNGPRTTTPNDENADPGLRGGIVIRMAFRQIINKIFDKEMLLPDGAPAVKVHNNVVTQPLGQALFIIALGPVSVIGNHLTSQGADFRVNPYSLLAGAVFILNLGIVKDLHLLLLVLQLGFRYLASANLSTTGITTRGADLTGLLQRILYLPSGSVLFSNNKTMLDLRSSDINFAFSAQAVASLDDIAYNSNQSECNSLIDILLTDVALLGVTIRSNDNRFQEGITVTNNSLFSLGLMNMATNNQSTHCLKVFGVSGSPEMPYTINQSNMALYWQSCGVEMIEEGNYIGVRPQLMAAPE
jgi:hypothetical protein